MGLKERLMRERDRHRVRRVALGLGAAVVLSVILRIDIATGVWQERVILAGVSAGLVTFVFTVLVLDRIVARSTAMRWAPVARLALTDVLHVVADEDSSEISRGMIKPRLLPQPPPLEAPDLIEQLHELRLTVVDERTRLTNVLAAWSSFLASSTDNEDLLIRIASIALQLDRVRDESLELEELRTPADHAELVAEISACNAHFSSLVRDIEQRIETDLPPLLPVRHAHLPQPAATAAEEPSGR